ncbi:ParB/RepB/Spo0J family partition protein [Actinocrispum wychmicini]|uniref:ParB-like nuclease family protein n=1 Tax=Actinocrispum wychmicini TaxID=1213861 RepID=A0A4R2JQN0_9PSEU|nr:ParB/RepB/Spo0J family partition protein [Actinocrispum wychmicini]TCO59498.1 ParB-like nuclease family protein [Actinocrispum wychmicini]
METVGNTGAESAPPDEWLARQLTGAVTTKMPIDTIVGSMSPRLTGESEDHVRLLAESEAKLPPIIEHRATMRVIDGMHRLRAAMLRGQHEINVRFYDGAETDTFVIERSSPVLPAL